MEKKENRLKIGYIWQYETADEHLTKVTATALHIGSVIAAFKKRGHQVRIISFLNKQPHWSDNGVDWHKIEPVKRSRFSKIVESIVRGIQSRLSLPYFNFFDSRRFSDACVAVVKDFDILYERFWMIASGGTLTSKRLGIPIVYEVNGDIVEEYRLMGQRLPRIHWSAIHFVTKHMFINSGKVIAVSDVLMERLRLRYRLNPEKICAIDNGARVDRFFTVDQAISKSLISKYGLSGKLNIIFVGTFKPWHGLDLLIDAFEVLVGINPDVSLILVGDGPLLPSLQKRVLGSSLDGKVIFTGMVKPDMVPNFLHIADIAVLNPRTSGASTAQSPLKLFEYMSAGRAIVAPKIPYVEKILTDRENALLIAPNNVESLKDAFLELASDSQLRRTLGQAAQQKALQEHSWDQVVMKIEDIFYSLIKNPHS